MSFLPRKGKYLYSGRLSTYKPQNIQVLVRIISCVQPDLFGLLVGQTSGCTQLMICGQYLHTCLGNGVIIILLAYVFEIITPFQISFEKPTHPTLL